MTGLDKIIKQIEADAEAQEADILEAAREEAAGILSQAETDGKQQAEKILAEGEEERKLLLARASSAIALASRKSMLLTKQRLIKETISEARRDLLSMPLIEYFSVIKKLIVRNAQSGKGIIYLNDKDLQRMPKSFEKELGEALSASGSSVSISREPRPIDGGFVLSYGGIEENCSFDALFEAMQDRLQDMVNTILFSAQ